MGGIFKLGDWIFRFKVAIATHRIFEYSIKHTTLVNAVNANVSYNYR